MDMAAGEPGDALASVQPALHVAQMASRVLDEAVAGKEAAVGGNAEIAGARTAGIRAVRAAMDLTQGLAQV